MKQPMWWLRQRLAQFGREDAGQAIVWVALMLPFFLAVVGVSLDGGLVFGARRELQNVADAAARAGAMQIDERVYRDSFGQQVVLDPDVAYSAAADYLALQPGRLTGSLHAGRQAVEVDVARDVPTGFLRLVGIETARVSATAIAEVRHGIERGER